MVVALGKFVALLHFPLKALELGQDNGALYRVHAPTHTHSGVNVALTLAVHADLAHSLGQGVIIREDGTTITVAAQGLAREKTGAADSAEVAALAAFVGGSKALSCIFDDRQISVLSRDGVDSVHVGSLAVKAHRHDGFRAGCDCPLNQLSVDVAGVELNIHEHGLGTQKHDNFGGSYKGERRSDDFIARANTQRHQAHEQGLGAAGTGDALICPREGSKLVFQLFDLRPHNVLAMLKHSVDAGLNLRLERLVLGFEVDEGDAHEGCRVN